MAMLAEPRRKQKWTLNPRGKHWSDDSNKFGQKMLEKMGWSSGKGLGANLDGMTEHIRCKYKNDQAGVGFSNDDRDKQWTQHQEGFNELLQKLHSGEAAETTSTAAENELSGKSLELKSKQSRARVHYQKFTRGKDVNKYSTKDLANIFGKKDLDEKSQEPDKAVEVKQEPEEVIPPEPIGSTDTSHGVMTIKGGSISDYFKQKMSSLGRKVPSEVPNDSESETETHAGFGFSAAKSETPKKSLETHFAFVNPALDIASPKETTITPRKRKNEFAFENPALEIASPKETPRKRKNEFAFENPALDIASPKETPRKRKNEFAFENPALDIASPKETPRKRKNEFAFENPALDVASPKETPRKRKSEFFLDTPTIKVENISSEIEHTPKRRKSEFAFENGGLDLETPQNGGTPSAISCSEELTKKKRKKKVKECVPPVLDGFTNEALNLESREDEASNSSQFEVPRAIMGLANDALDLTDETNGRKRVTFNETVEFDTDVASGKRKKKKNKNGGKLDKFEVDNEKLKRKKQKERKEQLEESAFVNEAMDVDVGNQEASDNAANERKSERARRKRDRRMSNLETIAEAPDEEKENVMEIVTLDESLVSETNEGFEDLSLETPKKKKNKKKKNTEENREADLETTIDITEEDIELVEEISVLDSELSRKKIKNEGVKEEESEGKKSKRKKKDLGASKQEEMEVTEVKVETVETPKKEKRKKKIVGESSKENVDTDNFSVAENLEVESAKKEKRRKKIVSESSKENVDTDNFSAAENLEVESAKKKKKPKKEKKLNGEEGENVEVGEGESVKIEEEEKKTADENTLENEAPSPWDGKAKKSKRTFKALFARSPVVNFVGSNINEIKGYGVDFK